jgi:DNA end-binding protein Ku
MSQTDRAALGRVVMRAKEYLAIVRARHGVLTLTTMLFADEIRPTEDVEAATQKSHRPAAKRLNAAVAVIEELTTEWDPERHEDEYRSRLKAVIRRKRKGETINSPEAAQAPSPAPDLMDALGAHARGDDERGRPGFAAARRRLRPPTRPCRPRPTAAA